MPDTYIILISHVLTVEYNPSYNQRLFVNAIFLKIGCPLNAWLPLVSHLHTRMLDNWPFNVSNFYMTADFVRNTEDTSRNQSPNLSQIGRRQCFIPSKKPIYYLYLQMLSLLTLVDIPYVYSVFYFGWSSLTIHSIKDCNQFITEWCWLSLSGEMYSHGLSFCVIVPPFVR